jgi:hypothetical protein
VIRDSICTMRRLAIPAEPSSHATCTAARILSVKRLRDGCEGPWPGGGNWKARSMAGDLTDDTEAENSKNVVGDGPRKMALACTISAVEIGFRPREITGDRPKPGGRTEPVRHRGLAGHALPAVRRISRPHQWLPDPPGFGRSLMRKFAAPAAGRAALPRPRSHDPGAKVARTMRQSRIILGSVS